MSRNTVKPRWLVAMLAIGCGPVIANDGDETTGDADTTTTGSSTSTGPTSAGTTTSTSDDSNPSQPSGPSDEVTTATPLPDLGDGPFDCSLWEQNCPEGEKCMPYADDGSGSWNRTRCTDVVDDPRAVGESCTAVESGASGLDDCDVGAMCWDVDPATLVGECISFCEGSEAEPTCDDACSRCSISGDGVLTLCLPTCDPVAQDCGADDQGCYPINDWFACAPFIDEQLELGDPCEFINVCPPGLFCADAPQLPACEGTGCCAPFCDVEAADTCDAQLAGTVCMPWYEAGQEPAPSCSDLDRVGGCLAPP